MNTTDNKIEAPVPVGCREPVSCFCGHKPVSYRTNMTFKGCLCKVWVVECSHDEDEEVHPYVEHRVTIYGDDKTQAEARWNGLFAANAAVSNSRANNTL